MVAAVVVVETPKPWELAGGDDDQRAVLGEQDGGGRRARCRLHH